MIQAQYGVDATFVVPSAIGGAEHMFRNLMTGLTSADYRGIVYRVFTRGHIDLPVDPRVDVIRMPASANRFLAATQAAGRYTGDLDGMLCANYFTPPFVRSKGRVVTVIHDLQYRHYPEFFTRRKQLWLRAAHELTLRRADTIVAISDFVRDDIVRVYGSKWRSKIVTIHNPISWSRFDAEFTDAPGAAVPMLGTRPYALCISAHYPHKNLDTLVRAFARYKQSAPSDDAALVIVGQRSAGLIGTTRSADPMDVARACGIASDVFAVGYVEDAVAGALYRGASVFVAPSLFEGFGMPSVEALGLGIPVVAAGVTALPEVTLGLATLVAEPRDVNAFASAMAAVLRRPDDFRPSAADVQRVRHTYDPSNVAARYVELLRGALP